MEDAIQSVHPRCVSAIFNAQHQGIYFALFIKRSNMHKTHNRAHDCLAKPQYRYITVVMFQNNTFA